MLKDPFHQCLNIGFGDQFSIFHHKLCYFLSRQNMTVLSFQENLNFLNALMA